MTKAAKVVRGKPSGTRAASASAPLQICLYGEINSWTARDIVSQLQAAPTAEVTLRVNSPGGEVLEGWALASALRSHAGRKVAVIEGVCASAATFPACACDEIHMHPESMLMIHAPWGGVSGGPDAMDAQSELLEKMASLCIGLYQRKTGADEQTVRDWLAQDTWMTPTEATDAGFCDQILTDLPSPSARARAARYLARLRPPKQIKDIKMAKAENENTPDGGAIPEHLAQKLSKYGMSDDSSPDEMQNAYRSYMAETEDGPAERREMSRAMSGLTEDEKPEAKVDDEEETSEDKSTKLSAKLSGLDPAVAKLVDALTSKVARLDKSLGTYQRAETERAEREFYASAAAHTSKEDAKEFLELCSGDTVKALAIIRKLPAKKGPGPRLFSGGEPVGGPSRAASHAEKTRVVGRVSLHGWAFSKRSQEIAKAEKISIGEAQLRLAKEFPDLLQG
jgi:ATP-dependent protease ClpP protease subunit